MAVENPNSGGTQVQQQDTKFERIKKYAPALVLVSGSIGFLGGTIDNNVTFPDAVQTQLAKEGLDKPTKEEVTEADDATKVFQRIAIQDVAKKGAFTPPKGITAYIKEANTTLANDKAFEDRKDELKENGTRQEVDNTLMLVGLASAVISGTIIYKKPRRG